MIYLTLAESGQARDDGDHPCSLWVPSEPVSCHRVVVPDVPRRKWQAMIPWMLEEHLLGDPANLEFLSGDRDADGGVPVLVVDAGTLAQWRRQAADSGRAVHQLIPDFFALPREEGEVVVAPQGGRALLRYGPWQGAAGPPDLIWSLAGNLLAEGECRLRLLGDRDSVPEGLPEPAVVEAAADLFAAPASPWVGFAPARVRPARRRARSGPARAAAVLAVLLLGLLGTAHVLETQRLRAQAAHLEDALKDGFQGYFGTPYEFPLADFQQVASRRLDGGRAPPEPALLTARLQRLEQLLNACGDCRVRELRGEREALGATLAGVGDGRELQRALDTGGGLPASVQRRGENWTVRIGGEVSDVRPVD